MSKKYKIRKKSNKPDPVPSFVSPVSVESIQRKNLWIDVFVKPQNIFTILALIFGGWFLIITPPFQVPDEIAHFDRVYKLAEFKTFQKIENNVSGDYVPANIHTAFYLFRYLSWKPDQKVEKQQIINALQIPLENDKREFVRIDASSYFYFSYLPQLPAVYLGKLFNMNVLYILYLGRFFGLLFFIVCVRYAIQTIPIGKFLLTVIAVMPICLAQAASYNADCVLFSVSFLSLALLLKISLSGQPLKMNKETLLLFLMLIILGVLKAVYLPIAFLIFIIPKLNFKTNFRFYALTTSTVLLSALLTVSWLKLNPIGAATTYNFANTDKKIELLMQHPLMFADVVSQSFNEFGKLYYQTTIGVLGYVDTVLPGWIYFLFTFLIIFLTLFEADKKFKLFNYQRILFLLISISTVCVVIFGIYLLLPQEGLVTRGVQGRYFVPALMPFFLAFYGSIPFKLNLSNSRVLSGLVFLTLFIALLGTGVTILNRYYIS